MLHDNKSIKYEEVGSVQIVKKKEQVLSTNFK